MSGITNFQTITSREQAWGFLSEQKTSIWAGLHEDAWVTILSKMNPAAILSSSLACKGLNALARDSFPWQVLFYKDFSSHVPYIRSQGNSFLEIYKNQYLRSLSNLANNVYSVRTLTGYPSLIQCLAVSEDAFFLGFLDGTLKILDLEKGTCLKTFAGKGLISSLAISDGKLFSFHSEGIINIRDLETYACMSSIEGVCKEVSSLVVENGQLFCGDSWGNIHIWDVNTGTWFKTLQGHQDTVNFLAVHKGRLISCSTDYTIRIWDLETYSCSKILEHDAPVWSFVTTENDLMAASNRTISVWDVVTGEGLEEFPSFASKAIHSMAIGREEFFTGCWDGEVHSWDLKSKTYLQRLTTHTSAVHSLLFTASAVHSLLFTDFKLISCSERAIKICDFAAPDPVIFKELAKELRTGKSFNIHEAMFRFKKMPESEKKRIYNELCEDAFCDLNGQKSTPEQKAQAIEDYLEKI